MKGNPKPEGRNPKEGRIPKAEEYIVRAACVSRHTLAVSISVISDFGSRPSFGLRI